MFITDAGVVPARLVSGRGGARGADSVPGFGFVTSEDIFCEFVSL